MNATSWDISPNATNGVNSTNATSGVSDSQVKDGFMVMIISLVIGMFNLIGGSLLLTALIKLRTNKLKTTTRYFLLNQTACHLLLGVVVLTRGLLDEFSCEYTPILPCLCFLICCSALFTSVDSFISIYKPFTHKLILTPRRAKLAILFMFIPPLVGFSAAVLTGRDVPENNVCMTVHDSYFTPAQVIAFMVFFLLIIVLSIVFQGWAILLIYRMNRVGPVPSRIPMSVVHGMEQAQQHLSVSLKTEPVAGPSLSGNYPRALQGTTHGTLLSPELPGDTKGVVTIHVLKSSEKDVPARNRLQHSQQVSTLHPNPTGNRPTRQKRLVRLLTAALILTVVAWSPAVVTAITVATYNLTGIEKPAWFDTARWQIGLPLVLDSLLYPVIVFSMSSELRACLNSLFCKLCRQCDE